MHSVDQQNESIRESRYEGPIKTAMANAQLPDYITQRIQNEIADDSPFVTALLSILQTDPYLWVLVDKEYALSEFYEPADLIPLRNASYRVNRSDMMLRSAAFDALEEMAAAARADRLTLVASSAYRSYEYQAQVYRRNVSQLGQEAADRESARPGHSQHQLGLVVDFGSITDAFADTPEGKWLFANASRFGWSLSYPEGYEHLTGYRWESWHYRYVGKELAAFIDTYFNGTQQYALRFIYEFNKF